MSQVADASILTHFSSLSDPRDNRGKEHLSLLCENLKTWYLSLE